MISSPWQVVALSFAVVAAVPAAVLGQFDSRDDKSAVEFFEKRVRPILVNNCYNCHSANTNARGGLRVDDRNGMIHGGTRGPAMLPGRAEQSLLIRAVRHAAGDLKMPPGKQLSGEQIADLSHWIEHGAAWPQVNVPFSLGKSNVKYERLRKEHWAWQPLGKSQPPRVRDATWVRDSIDKYVLAKLEEKGLRPVGDADRATLMRRVTFDLTGLPPTPAAIDAFVADTSPGELERLVDRLLASPAFGERWGRHWLDVARYGESTGSARNLPYPHAWRYRDYVIATFNDDKPYDRFICEQIAGDLLPAATARDRDQQLVATGFLALGVKDVNQRFKVRFVMDNIDEQIDTVSRAVLGLTASCARCHDHKFDPIPTTDYYALAGIFHSSDLCAGVRNKMGGAGMDYYDPGMLLRLGSLGPPGPEAATKVEQAKTALAQARAEFETLRGKPEGNEAGADGRPKRASARQKMERLQNELLTLTDPAARGLAALGLRDAASAGDTAVRVRGEAEKLGPVVPRGFLSVIDVPGASKIAPQHSGRLELTQWLSSARNPLMPRVMVNRIWQHLFGRGLVASVDNFGVTGDLPSHPELLDHLARRFVGDGWSVKKLVRALVLTRTYQLAADAAPANVAVDPANRLVWRHSPRRLDAEEIRDAMLVAAGTLDEARPGGSPAKDLKVTELRNNGPEAKRLETEALASKQRSIYLPLLRGLTPRALAVFDFAEQGMVTGSRDTTTVAPQALYLLNDTLVRQQALALAQRLAARPKLEEPGRIDLAYRLTLGRAPAPHETQRAHNYLAAFPPGEPPTAAWTSFCQALLASAEFRYIK